MEMKMRSKLKASTVMMMMMVLVASSSAWNVEGAAAMEFGDGNLHHQGKFYGEVASLPCEVNFDQCGQIYFLTWSKNISNEWQRVYLYSEAYQTVLGDFAVGGAGNRVRLDASNITTQGVAFLNIHDISPEDEGVYKCDVTYVHGTCPSLTYTKLFILVTPGDPVIRVNGKLLQGLNGNASSSSSSHSLSPSSSAPSTGGSPLSTKWSPSPSFLSDLGMDPGPPITVGPFDEGTTILLECDSSGGRPQPEVKWFNGTQPLRSKITTTEDPMTGEMTVSASTRFSLSPFDLGSVFTCVVSNNATHKPLIKQIILDLNVRPLSLKIEGPSGPVVAGEMVSLVCVVEGARPPPRIDWFNRSQLIDPQPRSSDELMEDNTYRTTSTLVFIASRYDHERDFSCMGTNQVLKEQNEVPLLEVITLKVLYAPLCSIRFLPLERNQHMKIQCVATSSPPVISYKWMNGNRSISLTDPGHDREVADHDILIIKNPDFESYSCVATNMMGLATCKLEAHKKQVSSSEGSEVLLPCEVDTAKCGKISRISWSKNVSSSWILLQEETLKGGRRKGGGEKALIKTGSSVLASALSHRISIDVKGSTNESHEVGLRMQSLGLGDEGVYKCDITYQQTACPSITYIKLTTLVIPQKPTIKVNGELVGKSNVTKDSLMSMSDQEEGVRHFRSRPFSVNSSVTLECISLGGKPAPSIHWLNGTRRLEGETKIEPDTRFGHRTTSYLKVHLTRSDLLSIFRCVVFNNATHDPLMVDVSFDLMVAPTHLHVRGPVAPVTAGNSVSLTCIVDGGRPAASILWFNQSVLMHPQPTSSSDLLTSGAFRTTSSLVFTASRYDHRRNFLCRGTNQLPLNEPSISTPISLEGFSTLNILYAGWAQLLLMDENLIVFAVAAGVMVFIIVTGVVGAGVFVHRKRCKRMEGVLTIGSSRMSDSGGRTLDSHLNHLHQHHLHYDGYSHGLHPVNHMTLSHKQTQIAILDKTSKSEEDMNNTEYMTICDARMSSSPLKSPLNTYHCMNMNMRPDGSPLLSDFVTDRSDSPTSTSSSIQHFYERPHHPASSSSSKHHLPPSHPPPGLASSPMVEVTSTTLSRMSHNPFHHLNIPFSSTLHHPGHHSSHHHHLHQLNNHPNHHPSSSSASHQQLMLMESAPGHRSSAGSTSGSSTSTSTTNHYHAPSTHLVTSSRTLAGRSSRPVMNTGYTNRLLASLNNGAGSFHSPNDHLYQGSSASSSSSASTRDPTHPLVPPSSYRSLSRRDPTSSSTHITQTHNPHTNTSNRR